MAAAALSLASPAAAAEPGAEICKGKHLVTRLAGPHAVTRKPIPDLAALRQRLPELEASIRAVVAKDPNLGQAVADALIGVLREGSEISERSMQRNESVLWMAYQPAPGQYEVITPACLRLDRSYEAFEITVAVADPVKAAKPPTCVISADRDCAAGSPSFTVDVRGSSPGARVTMTSEGGGATAIDRPSDNFTMPDARPYDAAATFTVKADGPPEPAQTARVYRFLMPKVCGNIAYLGESAGRTLAPAGQPRSCEKSVSLNRCVQAVPPPVGETPELEDDPGRVADSCEGTWVLRPLVFGYFPTGSDQERAISLPIGPATEVFSLDSGYGIGASVEKRITERFGIEGGLLAGRGTSEYTVESGRLSGRDTHDVNFYALMVGPNFHLTGCGSVDLYVGPFIGYGGFGDPNYWALDHHFRATFDGRFIWGGQIGLDLPGRNGRWGFHTGLRYIDLSQDTDAGSMSVDPLIVELGLTFGF